MLIVLVGTLKGADAIPQTPFNNDVGLIKNLADVLFQRVFSAV